MLTLKERTHQAIAAGFPEAELARIGGVTPVAVNHWKSGRTLKIKAEVGLRLARGTGFQVEWWVNGKGPREIVTGGSSSIEPVPGIITPTPIEWGDLMNRPLPETFSLVMLDDSMGDDLPKGTIVFFKTKGERRAGRPVLVKDSHNRFYVRDYAPKNDEDWLAKPRNAKYLDLDKAKDGLEILAYFCGSYDPS